MNWDLRQERMDATGFICKGHELRNWSLDYLHRGNFKVDQTP